MTVGEGGEIEADNLGKGPNARKAKMYFRE